MKYRPFGQTGIRVSEIGLGCWQFGGDFGPVDNEEAEATMEAAIQVGINFFDTANVYGSGQSESWIGNYLSKSRETVFVATKYGRGPGVYPDGYSLAGMRQQTLDAIERLRVEQIDLLQLHCVPTEILRKGEVFDWLRTLQQEGLIAHFGASIESVEEGLICLEQPGLATLQVIFNVLRQKPAHELFPQALKKGVGVIVRLPLASGLLSGKFTPTTQFTETDHRHYNRNGECFNVGETFAGLPFEKGVELAEGLRGFLPEGFSMVDLALRWILDHQAVTTVIAGAKRVEQVIANTRASRLPRLTPELHQQLAQYYAAQVREHIRGPY
ncbi:MAG: aldo/keto reductase [Planctomycetaceae bacterium]|nr:aldo/keto reductase [Planctomycetaceae bacterium]